MTEEEVRKKLEQIKPRLVPAGVLELAAWDGSNIKVKVTGLPKDMFKVQGKIIRTDEEIKKKIAESLTAEFSGVKVSFVD
jgi:hypothetical protein